MTQSHFKKLSSGQCSLEGNHNNKLIHQQKQNKKRKSRKIKKKTNDTLEFGILLAGSDFQKKTVLFVLMSLIIPMIIINFSRFHEKYHDQGSISAKLFNSVIKS